MVRPFCDQCDMTSWFTCNYEVCPRSKEKMVIWDALCSLFVFFEGEGEGAYLINIE